MAEIGAVVEAVSAKPRDIVIRVFEQIGEQNEVLFFCALQPELGAEDARVSGLE